MGNNGTATMSDLYLVTDSTKYSQSEFMENGHWSWKFLSVSYQWSMKLIPFNFMRKMDVLKPSILCASRTWQQMTVHKLFFYIFVFWSVLNKTGIRCLYSKHGITFIPKKQVQKPKFPESLCFFHKVFI